MTQGLALPWGRAAAGSPTAQAQGGRQRQAYASDLREELHSPQSIPPLPLAWAPKCAENSGRSKAKWVPESGGGALHSASAQAGGMTRSLSPEEPGAYSVHALTTIPTAAVHATRRMISQALAASLSPAGCFQL